MDDGFLMIVPPKGRKLVREVEAEFGIDAARAVAMILHTAVVCIRQREIDIRAISDVMEQIGAFVPFERSGRGGGRNWHCAVLNTVQAIFLRYLKNPKAK